jgi:hypothetical protein
MRSALLIFSFLGLGAFGLIFALSFLSPLLIEMAAREVVRIEVERRVGAKLDELSNSNVISLAQKALGKTDAELEEAKRALAADVPRKVAKGVADMLNADCDCRRKLTEGAVTAHEERVSTLTQLRERLAGLVESAYASVRNSLLRELRILTASNAVAFAVLGLVTYFRQRAALQLALPAVVLAGAVVATTTLYLFNQNWLHTVLYSQYVGLGYVAYLGLVAALLADIVFNRARVTTELVNIPLQVLCSALKAVPC